MGEKPGELTFIFRAGKRPTSLPRLLHRYIYSYKVYLNLFSNTTYCMKKYKALIVIVNIEIQNIWLTYGFKEVYC